MNATTVAGRLSVKFLGHTYFVRSVSEAADKWNEFRLLAVRSGADCGGSSQIGNGLTVRDDKQKIIAKVSYNGRVWNPDGTAYGCSA